MRRFVLVLAAASALVVGAAACGGGGAPALSKEDYTQKVTDAGNALGEAFSSLAAEAESASTEDVASGAELDAFLARLAASVGKVQTTIENEADELDSLTPPEDAEAANDKLVEGLRALAADIGELKQAVEQGDFSNIFDLAAQLQQIASSSAGQTISAALDELRGKGYAVTTPTG